MTIAELYDNVIDILEGIDSINAVYDYNISGLDKFPCALIKFDNADNEYLTNAENIKAYAFNIYIYQESVINGKQSSYRDIFLPVLSDILDEFDSEWDGGTTSSGHRIWSKSNIVSTGIVAREQGDLLYGEIKLLINLANNI